MKKIIRTIFVIFMTVILAACSSASPAEEKAPEPDLPDYIEEGINYWHGFNGVEFNKEKARSCFRQAADLNEADAYYWLAEVRITDIDPERKEEVIELYNKAIDEGSDSGLYGLGNLYVQGWGVDKDPVKPDRFIRKLPTTTVVWP